MHDAIGALRQAGIAIRKSCHA